MSEIWLGAFDDEKNAKLGEPKSEQTLYQALIYRSEGKLRTILLLIFWQAHKLAPRKRKKLSDRYNSQDLGACIIIHFKAFKHVSSDALNEAQIHY